MNVIRFLGHDGLYHFFAGTTSSGDTVWTTDPDASFSFQSDASVKRIISKCDAEGLDVEVITVNVPL